MGSETVRNLGFESDITTVQALVPQALQDATPVLSSAIDTRLYPRTRIVLVGQTHEVTGTTHTTAFTVTESATSGGSYTASTTSGTLTASAATDVIRIATVRRNQAMPFIKVTITGSHADVDVLAEAHLLFINDNI